MLTPPGAPLFFAFLYARDPTLSLAVGAMLALAILLPLAVGGLGWAAFGKTTGKIAMAISSVYFPFIDYGGHFLTETPMTLLFALTMLLYLLAMRQPSAAPVLGWSVATGVALSITIAFKVVALPAMVCMVLAHLFLFRPAGDTAIRRVTASRRLRVFAAMGVFLGAIPLTAAMSIRCARGNEGRMCFVCTKGPSDFLLGHYGRVQGIRWRSDTGHVEHAFSAAAIQHGYKELRVVPFDIADGPANSAAAWHWIGAHPVEALVLSCEHVYNLFGSFPTPGVDTPSWMLIEASHFAFCCSSCFRACSGIRENDPDAGPAESPRQDVSSSSRRRFWVSWLRCSLPPGRRATESHSTQFSFCWPSSSTGVAAPRDSGAYFKHFAVEHAAFRDVVARVITSITLIDASETIDANGDATTMAPRAHSTISSGSRRRSTARSMRRGSWAAARGLTRRIRNRGFVRLGGGFSNPLHFKLSARGGTRTPTPCGAGT